MRSVFFVIGWSVIQPLVAHATDFENRRVDWELTPLGRLAPSVAEDDLTRVSRIKDKETILNLLRDPKGFALVHVALCRLYEPPLPNLAMLSADQVDGNYFGLRVRITYKETRRSITKNVSYPDVDSQLAHLLKVWELFFEPLPSPKERPVTLLEDIRERRKTIAAEVGNKPEGGVADIHAENLEYPSYGIGFRRPVVPDEIAKIIRQQLVFEPRTVFAALTDNDKSPIYHIALTDLFFPENVYNVDRRGVQDVFCNGLSITINVRIAGDNRIPSATYPKLDIEKHRIALFWHAVLEQ